MVDAAAAVRGGEDAAADAAVGAGGADGAVIGRSARGVEEDAAGLDADAVGADPALVGALRRAGRERDDQAVQRAGHAVAVDDAVGERAALVRAAVVEGEDGVVGGAEDGDAAAGVFTTRPPRRGMCASSAADVEPARSVTADRSMRSRHCRSIAWLRCQAIGGRGLGGRGQVGERRELAGPRLRARSAQGSRW